MNWTLPVADRFAHTLRGLRNADRFAVGRRILSVVALGVLADSVEPGVWRTLRGHLHANTLNEARSILLRLATTVEKREPRLERVFTEVLVNDAIHSRSLVETLSGAMAILSELGPDVDRHLFGLWFNASLEEVASAGPAIGDLATSRDIAQLLIGLAEVQPGQTVYDPCSGLGGLLALAEQTVEGLTLVGRDIHPISWAFGSLRLHLLDAQAEVELGDSLERRPEQYDRVICDPPSNPYPERRRSMLAHSPSVTASRRYEGLFVDHCAASLKTGGRGTVLVNQGFLARRGLDEEVRRSLLRQGLLEGIVALPAGFSPWTYADLAILVLSDPPGGQKGIRLIDGSLVPGWQKGRQRATTEVSAAVLEMFRSGEETGFATTVPPEMLAESGQFRPSQYFIPPIERRSVADLLAEAESFEGLAAAEADQIEDLLFQLGLRGR